MEVDAADRQRLKQRQQTQAETDKLLEDRKQQLDILAKEHSKLIEPIQNSILELKGKVKDLSHEKITLEGDITSLDAEISSKRETLSALKTDIEASGAILDDLNSKHSGVQTSVDSLSEQKLNLETKNTELVDKNNELVQKNRELLTDTATNKNKFEVQSVEQLRTLNNQRAEIRSNASRLEEESSVQERVREDLAVRIRAVEEREKNIKIREYKLDRDQATISRNADLLEL